MSVTKAKRIFLESLQKEREEDEARKALDARRKPRGLLPYRIL